jgi:3-hydroxymyristoyl/3-hydroxydecanoyl-(acyl carrier protein) dehydratase
MRFLFVDRILHSEKGKFIQGLKHVTADDYYLAVTETGRPHFAISLMGEILGQLAAWNVMDAMDFTKRPVAGMAFRAVVHRPAFVGETLWLESTIDSLDEQVVQYHSVARVQDEVIFTVDGALGPLLPMTDFIDEQDVRRQFAEIYRPIDDYSMLMDEVKSAEAPIINAHQPIAFTPMFDDIVMSEPGVQLTAVKRISRAAPYFPDHFPRKPVLPLTILLECKVNLAREFLKRAAFQKSYRICEMRRIKMKDFVLPGDVVTCHVSVKRQDDDELVLSFNTDVLAKRVCSMELVLRGV